jgi:uncharacterized RDD family membrane protein YckC
MAPPVRIQGRTRSGAHPATTPNHDLPPVDSDPRNARGPRPNGRAAARRRFRLAILFDTALLFIFPVCLVELLPRNRFTPDRPDDNVLVAAGAYCLVIFVIQIVLSFRGQTIGKRVFKIRAIDLKKWQISSATRTMGRLFTHGALILAPVSAVAVLSFFPPLFLGVCAYAVIDGFFILFGDRCLHDYCGGTVVVSDHHL